MVPPNIENVSAIINKIQELKGQKEKLKRTEFLTPVQREIFNAQIDIKWYIWKLTEKEKREHFYNHNIPIQYVSARKGRFVVTNENELKLYAEDKPGVSTYRGERVDLEEEFLVGGLKDKLKKARREYWQENIQPLIREVDKLLFPHWDYLTLYGSWFFAEKIHIEAAIKSTDPSALDEVVRELDKIRYKIQVESKQSAPKEPAGTGQGNKTRGRPKKYTDSQLKRMLEAHKQCYYENNDSMGAWSKVADLYGIKSGNAARVACQRLQKST